MKEIYSTVGDTATYTAGMNRWALSNYYEKTVIVLSKFQNKIYAL